MENKICRKCKEYIKHDEYFGYCKRYDCQARWNDNCIFIKEMQYE